MKKTFLILIVLVLMVSFQSAFAVTTDYTNEADMLNSLGLFNGTTNGYELDRIPTRIESAAMLVRLLGAESEAKENNYKHPFTDVPEWANYIAGYLYEKGLTKGIGNNLFGSNQNTITRDYSTFMLRSLGYGDSDFNYQDALNFAVSKDIITTEELEDFNSQEFKRNEMVLLSYNTLKVPVKGDSALLAEKLVESGVISAQKAYDAGMGNYEVLPIKVYKENGKLKIDYYYSKLSPIIKEMYKKSSSSNNYYDYSDEEYLAKSSIVATVYEKKRVSNDKTDNIGIDYNADYYTDIKFYDKDYVLNYYCIINNVSDGEHYIVLNKVSEEVKSLMSKHEDEFAQYRVEKIKKISTIPSKAYNIEKVEGKYYITIDRSKLPVGMKDAAYYGQSGVSDSDYSDDVERMLAKFYSTPNAYRFSGEYIDGEPIEILYYGYDMFTLLDENEDVIGVTILEIN